MKLQIKSFFPFISSWINKCIKSEEEAKKASKIRTKRPNPPGIAERNVNKEKTV